MFILIYFVGRRINRSAAAPEQSSMLDSAFLTVASGALAMAMFIIPSEPAGENLFSSGASDGISSVVIHHDSAYTFSDARRDASLCRSTRQSKARCWTPLLRAVIRRID